MKVLSSTNDSDFSDFKSRKQKKRTPKKQVDEIVKKLTVIVDHTYIDPHTGEIWKRDPSLIYGDIDPNDLPKGKGKWWVPFGVEHIDWSYGLAWNCRCGSIINADSRYKSYCGLCERKREFRRTGKICPKFKAAQEEKDRKYDANYGNIEERKTYNSYEFRKYLERHGLVEESTMWLYFPINELYKLYQTHRDKFERDLLLDPDFYEF